MAARVISVKGMLSTSLLLFTSLLPAQAVSMDSLPSGALPDLIAYAEHGEIEYTDAYPADTAELEEKAAAGDADSLFTLGVMYYFGYNVPKDLDKSLQFYNEAADKNHAAAQYNLGMMYLSGEGVKSDPEKAAGYLQRAAESGVVLSQINLGLLYLEGRGVKRDPRQAVVWLSKAAETGEPESCFALGKLYVQGDSGVPKDIDKGIKYLIKAAEQDHDGAKLMLECLKDSLK